MIKERDFWKDFKRKELMVTLIKNVRSVQDVIDGDGHSIYKSDWLIQQGLPEELVRGIEREFKSDYSSAKSTIFDGDGNMVDSMTGVSALQLHYEIAAWLLLEGGVDYNDTLTGRGFQAKELAQAIKKSVGMLDVR
jgi:hypothetical protein